MAMISSFLTLKDAIKRKDPFLECIASALMLSDELVIVDGGSTDGTLEAIPKNHRIKVVHKEWPEEFTWDIIGKQFQFGYEQCSGEFVFHLDCDYIFHQDEIDSIRKLTTIYHDKPGITFPKAQFILVDRYTIKSNLVIAVNKGVFGDRIKFDSGGDNCAPSLDGVYLEPSVMPHSQNAIWNYDFSFKTKEVIKKDFHRFAKAWFKTYGVDKLGAESEEKALEVFMSMMIGRFNAREHKIIRLAQHPIFIQNKIIDITPDEFGYSGYGALPTITYKGG